MSYGFKLFVAEVTKGLRGRAALDVSKVGKDFSEHYADYLYGTVLPRLIELGTLTGNPALARDSASGELPPISENQGSGWNTSDPRVRFEWADIDGRNVYFNLTYGKVGTYSVAAAWDPDDDAEMRDKSASHMHRCALFLPERGERGILAVESVGVKNPVTMVIRWLKRASHECGRTSIPQGETFGIRAWGLVDLDRLRGALQEANDIKIRLIRKAVSGSSARSKNKLVVENAVTTFKERGGVLDWASRILGRQVSDELDRQGVAELAELVDGHVGGMEFDDGYVVVETKSGAKKIGPTHLDTLFVYPVSSDVEPDDSRWRAEVKKVVNSLQVTAKVSLDLSDDR